MKANLIATLDPTCTNQRYQWDLRMHWDLGEAAGYALAEMKAGGYTHGGKDRR
jgi:hypothetical protein